MASISTCLTITAKSQSKPSLLLLKPSQFHSFRSQILDQRAKFRNRSFFPVIRAGIDVPASGIRPGGIIESDKLPSNVQKRTMDAVDACGQRVTIGDVASKAGIKLSEAQKALQAVAADTSGFLEVSDEADVLYVFPRDYRSKLSAKSLKIKTRSLIEKAESAADYVVRVSFGTALIASIVLVYTTIIAILSSHNYGLGGKNEEERDSSFESCCID